MSTQLVVTIDAESLRRILETSIDTGQATAGGVATLTDTAKDWPVNGFANFLCEITEGIGKGQIRQIASNIATILTIAPAWTTQPDATSHYRIGFFGVVTGFVSANITQWGGVAQTGADLTPLFQRLDVALSTRASQVTIASILSQLDVALSTRASQATLTTRASEATLIALFSPLSDYQSFLNPIANPELVLDTEGRPQVEIWAKSIIGGITINVYGSRNGTDWRLNDILLTDAVTFEANAGYFSAYRYVGVEIVETGVGTAEIEITATR